MGHRPSLTLLLCLLSTELIINGSSARMEIEGTATSPVGRSVSVVLKSVDFLCTQSSTGNGSRLNVSVELNVKAETTRSTVFFIQVFARQMAGTEERAIHSSQVYSTLVTLPIELPDGSQEVQVRASVGDGYDTGLVEDKVVSRWWSVNSLRVTNDVPLQLFLQRQMWHEDRAAALLSIDWPAHRIPSCDLLLKIAPHGTSRSQKELAVQLDSSRQVVVPRLHYEETYDVQVMTSASMAPGTTLEITVDPCRMMVIDSAMCPPPSVSALSYQWNTTNTFTVFWSFEDPSNTSSHNFLVTLSLQPKVEVTEEKEDKDEGSCNEKITYPYTADIRAATFGLSSPQCAFSVELIVIDARNRRSRGVTIDSRRAKTETWQQAANGGIGAALLWVFFIIVCVTGVVASIMAIRHQQRSSAKRRREMQEREQQREILGSLYGTRFSGRYFVAPLSASTTFLTAPILPLTEEPPAIGGDNRNDLAIKQWLEEANYANRPRTDDEYAVVEQRDETVDEQANFSLFRLSRQSSGTGESDCSTGSYFVCEDAVLP